MIPKFRAYDEETETMFDVLGFDLDDNEIWSYDQSYELNKCKIMQSTGLKDRNSVEIYEGDIIEWRYVITHVDSSQQGNLGMSIGFYAQRDDFESYHMLDVGDEYEVLGNIYENPELLEVE